MTRMARTQTNIRGETNGMSEVGTKRFGHVVPQQVGASAGIQPFAGDLSSAFQNFFGQVSNAADKLVQADFVAKKQEAQNQFVVNQEAGVSAANKISQTNPTMSPKDAELQLSEDQRSNNAFLTTFRKTMGSNAGDQIYADFKVHMATQDPSTYEQQAMSWWKKNYGNGTGDPTVDTYMQSTWMRNYESDRVSFAGKAIENQREATSNEIMKNAGTRLSMADFGPQDIANIAANYRSGPFGGVSDGKAMAQAVAALKISAVSQGRTATTRLIAALHQPYTAKDGTQTTLAQMFPEQMGLLEGELTQGLMNYTTLKGAETVSQAMTDMQTVISSYPDELQQFTALTNFFTAKMGELAQTPGIGNGLETFRAAGLKQLGVLKAYGLGMNRMGAFHTGEIPAGFDVDEFKKYGMEYMNRNFNVIDGKQGVPDQAIAVNAGMFLRRAVERFGVKAIDDDMVKMFAQGVLSDDPATAARSAIALKTLDGSGLLAEQLLGKDDAAALAKFRYLTQGNATITTGDITQRGGSYDVRMKEAGVFIQKAGGTGAYLFQSEGTKAKQEAKFNEEFLGDSMGEAMEEAMGLDKWGTATMSPDLQLRVRNMVDVAVQQRLANNQPVDIDSIRRHVADQLSNSVVRVGDTIELARSVPNPTVNEKGQIVAVPLGNGVFNPATGKAENTAETFDSDKEALGVALEKVAPNGSTMLDGKLSFTPAQEHRDVSGYWVGDEFNNPVNLAINEPYQMQPQFKEGDSTRSWWISRWGRDSVRFTGNVEEDQRLANRVLGPGVKLIPNIGVSPDANGELKPRINGYRLLLTPRLTGHSTMSLEELQRAAVRDPRNAPLYLEELRMRREGMMVAP
jgi:hypothetical protein